MIFANGIQKNRKKFSQVPSHMNLDAIKLHIKLEHIVKIIGTYNNHISYIMYKDGKLGKSQEKC